MDGSSAKRFLWVLTTSCFNTSKSHQARGKIKKRNPHTAALEMTRSELLRVDSEIGLVAAAAVGVCGGVWLRVNVLLLSDVSGDVLLAVVLKVRFLARQPC